MDLALLQNGLPFGDLCLPASPARCAPAPKLAPAARPSA